MSSFNLVRAGVAQRIGKLAPKLPEFLTRLVTNRAIDEQRLCRANDPFEVGDFRSDRLRVAVQFDDEERAATFELLAAGPFAGGGERETIGDLQGAGQEAGLEHFLQRARRGARGIESHSETGA